MVKARKPRQPVAPPVVPPSPTPAIGVEAAISAAEFQALQAQVQQLQGEVTQLKGQLAKVLAFIKQRLT
jgi:two-component system response regulator